MNKVSGLKRNNSRRRRATGIQDTIKVGSGVVGASLPSESCKGFCPAHAHKSQGQLSSGRPYLVRDSKILHTFGNIGRSNFEITVFATWLRIHAGDLSK